jgi:chemotaxis protein CheD
MVLGSCVAVVLLDVGQRSGGATHFLLPFEGGLSPRFANGAITELLRQMTALGSQKSTLVAKIFGGSRMLGQQRSDAKSLGTQNVDAARQRLAHECIPTVAEDVGGDAGRKLVVVTDLGSVWVKRLGGGA